MRIGEESAGSSGPAAELLEAQRQLRGERRRYFELFRLAPVGLLVTDLRGQITEINQANRLEQRVEERTRELQEEQALLEAVVYTPRPAS